MIDRLLLTVAGLVPWLTGVGLRVSPARAELSNLLAGEAPRPDLIVFPRISRGEIRFPFLQIELDPLPPGSR